MEDLRSLSVLLTEQMAEAKALLNLKAEFGRLPDSWFKTQSIRQIEDWFEPRDLKPRVNGHKGSDHLDESVDAESCDPHGLTKVTPDSMASEEVPDDGKIPF